MVQCHLSYHVRQDVATRMTCQVYCPPFILVATFARVHKPMSDKRCSEHTRKIPWEVLPWGVSVWSDSAIEKRFDKEIHSGGQVRLLNIFQTTAARRHHHSFDQQNDLTNELLFIHSGGQARLVGMQHSTIDKYRKRLDATQHNLQISKKVPFCTSCLPPPIAGDILLLVGILFDLLGYPLEIRSNSHLCPMATTSSDKQGKCNYAAVSTSSDEPVCNMGFIRSRIRWCMQYTIIHIRITPSMCLRWYGLAKPLSSLERMDCDVAICYLIVCMWYATRT